ncbi:GNAT family N-acetyltransferase [Chloroflexota bacterium]
MIIRKATVDEAAEIMNLHNNAVLALCRDDYAPEQLQGWVNASSLEKYQQRLEKHRSFAAELSGELIGYIRWNPDTYELCSVFVLPDYARLGVATQLMDVAEKEAISMGVNEMWLDASLTAVPFYDATGWEYVEQTMHGQLECVKMTKQLSGCHEKDA